MFPYANPPGRFLAVCLVALLAAPALAQDDAEKKPAEPGPKKLSESDIKKLEKPFSEAMEYATSGGPAVLADELKKLGHGDEDGNVDGAILGDVEGWQKLLDHYNVESLGKDPSGTGRIKEGDYIEVNRGGDYLKLAYSYRLPKDYTHDRAWPLVLCFHDAMDKGDGKSYLKKVWEQDRAAKELADQFILVAPHIGEKSLGGRVKSGSRGDSAKQFRFDWFTTEHAMAMIKPLVAMRTNYNVDPSRIYVSGTGQGAEMAVQLGALYGVETFAAVVARHGQPRDLKYVEGLKDVPTLFLYREGGDYDKGDRAAYWDKIKSTAKASGVDTVTIEKVGAMKKLGRKQMAGQKTDPLLDAQGRVASFLAEQAQPRYPTKLRIVTDNRAFLKKSFVRLTKLDMQPGKFIEAEVAVDREKNVIDVKGEDFYGLTLFLNDDILDLDRPIEVVVNGEMVLRKQVQRSLAEMLRFMRNPFLGRVWSAVLTAEVVEKEDKKEEATEGGKEEKKEEDPAADGGEKKDDAGEEGK